MIGNNKTLIEFLSKQDEDSLFELTKKQEKTLLSRAQQKYYFGVVIKMISEEHGYTPVETHNLIKLQFNLETTTSLSKDEFSFMINLIRDYWNTNFNFYIPVPNEIEDLRSLEKYLF